MVSQMSESLPEEWSSTCFTDHFVPISAWSHGIINSPANMDETLIRVYIRSRDQRIVKELETQWFAKSKEFPDAGVIKQQAKCWRLPSGQRMDFSCKQAGKYCKNQVKYYIAHPETLSERISFLQNSDSSCNVNISHLKLSDLHLKFWNTQPNHLILSLRTAASFIN
jgi:hypothetical protein